MRIKLAMPPYDGAIFGTGEHMMWRRFSSSMLLTALLLVALSACGNVKPIDYTEPHDIQPGPGLFSGKHGDFVLFGDRKPASEIEKDKKPE